MSMSDKQQADREITYRVGWKKGKIHVPEHPISVSNAPNSEVGAQDPELRKHWNKAMIIVWRKMPYPSHKIAAAIVTIVPAVSFAAIVWLVAQLAQG